MWNFISHRVWAATKTTKFNRAVYATITSAGVGIIASPFGVLMYLNL